MNEFHENRVHGTTTFPLQVYSHHDHDGFYSVSQHWHEELEWIYVDTGILQLTIHGRPYTLKPGQFCFINTGELHEIKSTGESLHHAIVFQATFLDFELYDSCEHQFIRPVTSGQLSFPTLSYEFTPGQAEQILGHLKRIVSCYHTRVLGFQLDIKIQILQVLEILYQANAFTKTNTSPKEMENLNKLKKVITYIQSHYQEPLTLHNMASLAYLSPAYFCHSFHQETGTSPIAFLNEYRIERAAQMLAESESPISEIASAVGFDNFSYFIRKFREYKRVSPKDYRRQTRQLNE